MEYRKEIDGLRALAVIPVILFHAGFTTFSAGFLGVDVFFVISGYLITSIIIAEKEAGRFSLIGFYERRARRILPALFFLLSIVSILSFVLMLPSQLKEFGQSLIATTLFSANIFFWLKTDYWGQSAELMPLLHIWSLGVEEQFYLFFPLFLIFIKTKKLKTFFLLTLVLGFFVMLYAHSTGHISEAFYLLPFRAWELIAGAMAVFWKIELPNNMKKTVNLLALAALISSYIFLSEHTNPALLYSIPIIATFLVIALPVTDGIASTTLKNSYVVYVGTISYSLYLFHQPIFALLRIANFGPLSLSLIIACLITTFIMAAISFKFVETPFKNRTFLTNKSIFLLSALCMTSFLLLGGFFHQTEGLREYKLSKMDYETRGLFVKFEESKAMRGEIWPSLLKNAGLDFENTTKLKVLFIGDSLSGDLFVAGSLSQEITSKAQLRRISFDDECIKNMVTNGGETGHDSIPCKNIRDKFLNSSLLRDSDVIVIAEAWLSNAEYLPDFLSLPHVQNKKIIVYLTHAFSNMNSLLLYLDKSKVQANSSKFKKFVYLNRHGRTIEADIQLQNIATEYKLNTIDAYNFFCDKTTKECTVIDDSGYPMIIDQTHLSGHGVIKFSPWFSTQLKQALNL